MSEYDSNDKDIVNEPKRRRLPTYFVNQEADRLVRKYSNPDGRKLYCKAYYRLMPERITELEHEADTSGRKPGRLFTVLLNDAIEEQAKLGDQRRNKLDDFRDNYGR